MTIRKISIIITLLCSVATIAVSVKTILIIRDINRLRFAHSEKKQIDSFMCIDTTLPTLSGGTVTSIGTIIHAGDLSAETSDSAIQSEPQPFQLSANGVRVERLSVHKGIYHYRISVDTGMTHLRLDGYSRSSDVKVQFLHP